MARLVVLCRPKPDRRATESSEDNDAAPARADCMVREE